MGAFDRLTRLSQNLTRVNSGSSGGAYVPGPGDTSMKSVIASCVFDLDATIAESYPGTGDKWANLVPNPADGSSREAYDFKISYTGGQRAVFTGTAGSESAYFLGASAIEGNPTIPGSGYFLPYSGQNTDFINGFHKTTGGNAFWGAAVFYSATTGMLQFATGATAYGAAPLNGWGMNTLPSPYPLRQHHVTNGTFNTLGTSSNLTRDQFHAVLWTLNPLTGDSKIWVGSAIGTPASNALTPTVANASGLLVLCASNVGGGSSSGLRNGDRVVSYAMGNEYLTDDKAALIISELEARHNRDYTP